VRSETHDSDRPFANAIVTKRPRRSSYNVEDATLEAIVGGQQAKQAWLRNSSRRGPRATT
jgi:hypothetical protein